MRKTLFVLLRVVAIAGILVYAYFLFTQQPVPKWTLLVFAGSMLLILFINLYQHLKSRT